MQGYREYDFDEAVEQLTRIWANALQLEEAATDNSSHGRNANLRQQTAYSPLVDAGSL